MEQGQTYETLLERIKSLEAELDERKKAEKKFVAALRRGKKRLVDLIEKNADAIILIDEEGLVQFANPACESLFGREREGFEGKVFGFPAISGKSTEIQIHQKNGSVRTAEMLVTDMIWDDKVCHLATLRDITARKEAEEKLEASEEKYRLLVESATDAIVIAQEGFHKFANSRIESITGYTPEEFKKIFYLDIIHPEDRSMVREKFEKRIKGEDVPNRYSCRMLTKSGDIRWLQINAIMLPWEGKPASLAFFRDITEQRNLEAQFQQAQKMEAVGTLAGGVAHDFNNLLTTILGNTDLSLMELDKDDPMRELLEEIKKAGQSASSLTRHLLAFSRKQVVHPEIIDLNQILKDIEKMIRRLIGENIEINSVLSEKLHTVKVDPGEFEQVILNLIVNARDAMPRGGRIHLETANTYLDRNYFLDHGEDVKPGNYVMLTVSDTGIGMDEKIRARIFEPFFTTKEKGKGTGLGLSTVYGIIRQSGGFIWVYSEPDKGAVFKIYLPWAEDEDMDIPKEIVIDKPIKGFETILLVEDDTGLRKMAKRVLSDCGYQVLEAENGEEALEISKRYGGMIQLLLTDMVMPGMSGSDLAYHFQSSRPGVKVLLMSGYTNNGMIDAEIIESGKQFLPKPFSPAGLVSKIRAVLDSSSDE